LSGPIAEVTATLTGLAHTFPDDVEVLLVGPTGVAVVLTCDAGGGGDVAGITLTFSDAAPAALPDNSLLSSGTFRPTLFSSCSFAPPAPGGSQTGTSLAAFAGTNPNGTWALYVQDDAGGDTGAISGGFSLTLTTADPTATPTPSATPAEPSATAGAATVTATATAGTPGPGGGGEEPQDRVICESLPGGPRELLIKESEWPAYRSRSARGPCPAAGAPRPAVAPPPVQVPGAAGTIPPGPRRLLRPPPRPLRSRFGSTAPAGSG
jgi:subtilisin-like proprotein convertase family protein